MVLIQGLPHDGATLDGMVLDDEVFGCPFVDEVGSFGEAKEFAFEKITHIDAA